MKLSKNKKFILNMLIMSFISLIFLLYFQQLKRVLIMLLHVSLPLIMGFAVAYILNLLVVKIEQSLSIFEGSKLGKIKRPLSIVFSLLTIILIMFLLLSIVLPQIKETLSMFANKLPTVFNILQDWIMKNQDQFPVITDRLTELEIDWIAIGSTISSFLIVNIKGFLNTSLGLATNTLSNLFSIVMSITFAIYLLSGKETIISQMRNFQKVYFSKTFSKKVNSWIRIADESFSSYIVGQCLEAFILGSLCTVGMTIFRLPFAVTIGVFVGTTALIPIFGAYLSAAVGSLLILTVSTPKAFFFLIFIIVLQQLENNFIYPKVVGNSVGLPGMWILVSVTVGGGLFGILGMILSVPIFTTIYKILQKDIRNKLYRVNNEN